MFAKHPEMAAIWQAETPRDKKLPARAKQAHALGVADALERFGFKAASEELRLKIPSRTFHGFDAAKKTEALRNAKKANNESADLLAEVFDQLDEPQTVGEQPLARDLERNTAWGAPSNLAGGDAGNRVSDMGQPTGFGGV